VVPDSLKNLGGEFNYELEGRPGQKRWMKIGDLGTAPSLVQIFFFGQKTCDTGKINALKCVLSAKNTTKTLSSSLV